MNSININLERIRKSSGLSAHEIAEIMDTCDAQIYRIERAKSPTLDALQRYADACGYDVRVHLEKRVTKRR